MSNLFIIGNGFDLAHKMSTSYEDFHNFLRNKYDLTDEDEWWLDKPSELENDKYGESYPTEKEIARLFSGLISNAESCDLWKDVEKDMGILDYSECFDEECWIKNEDYDLKDNIISHKHYNAEHRAQEIYLVLNDIECILRKWIRTVEISKDEKSLFKALINPNDDLFLSFNYTKTLECLYKCKEEKVCHIHGCVDCKEKLIIGHGNDKEDFYKEKKLPDSDGVRNIIEEIHNTLRKKTNEAIAKNKSFFDKLINSDITEIYDYGFSFSSVDIPYIQHICSLLDTSNMTWFLNDYDKKHLDCRKTIIGLAGFKGKIDTYTVSK